MLTAPAHGGGFAPGHVTGFFEIRDEARDVEKRGSRGAGFNTELGARTVATVTPSDAFACNIELNGAPDEAPVTRSAVQRMLEAAALDGKVGWDKDAPRGARARVAVNVRTELDLPIGQGFGMSAAGALSTAIAVGRALRIGRAEAVRAAHAAEIQNKSGLGDVIGAATGGFEVRVKPGLPPWGAVHRFIGVEEVVLCVLGERVSTATVLSDRAKRAAVNAAGARAVDALVASPTLEDFVGLSWRFAEDAGLATDAHRAAVDACREDGVASMVMLGGSVFAFGRSQALVDALTPFGDVHVSAIDGAGARALPVEVQNAG